MSERDEAGVTTAPRAPGPQPGQPELAFFGAVTAGLSHELKNVLATINEFAGLMEDLLLAAQRGKPLKTERLASVGERIGRQVSRGESLIGRLNHFAHTVDAPLREVDLTQLLGETLALSQRTARLRQVELRGELPGEPVELVISPFTFHQVVMLCLGLTLECAAGAGQQATVRMAPEQPGTPGGAVLLELSPAHGLPGEEVTKRLPALGGELSHEPDGAGGGRLLIRLHGVEV